MEKNQNTLKQVLIEKSYIGRDIDVTVIQKIGKLKSLKVSDASTNQDNYSIKSWNVPQHNPNFTGRKSLLNEIRHRMQQPELGRIQPVVITACHGLGGVGKTQLTIEYIHQNFKDYQMICWIPADSSEQIETAYLELAQDLGLITTDKRLPPNEVILMVKAWFIAHPTCLLVYDNAPNYQIVESFLPQTGSQILITSRHTEWPEAGIQVDVFTVEEAREFIEKILGKQINVQEEQVDKLAEILGRLPLALAQATAYIKKNKIAVARYIELYEKRKAEILSKAVLPPGDQHAVVYVTWDITMEQIQKESPLAPKLLTLCAYLHHDGIPRKLLAEFSQREKNSKDELSDETIGTLLSYSMLNADMRNDSLSIHALVQEVIRLKLTLKDQQHYLSKVFSLFKDFYPYGSNKESLDDFNEKRILLLHLEYYINQLDSLINKNNEIKVTLEKNYKMLILNFLCDCYEVIGNYEKENLLLKNILELTKEYSGIESLETADAMVNFALNLRQKGQPKEAAKLIFKALEIEYKLEADKAEIARTLVNYSDTLGLLGEFEQQMDYIEKAYNVERQLYGADSKELIVTLNSLGHAYKNIGNYIKAKITFTYALSLAEKYYDNNHPYIANILFNLANISRECGDRLKSHDSTSQAIEIRKNFYGETSSEYSEAIHQLAGQYILENTKEYAEKALELAQKALKITESYYDDDNPKIAAILTTLASAHGILGELDAKHSVLVKAISILEKSGKHQSSNLAKAYVNLANNYWAKQEIEKAYDYYHKAFTIENNIFGDSHPELIITLLNFGQVCRELKSHDESLQLLKKAKEIIVSKGELDKEFLAVILYQLGATYKELKNYSEAREAFGKAYQVFSSHPKFGITHKYTIDSKEQIDSLEGLEIFNKYIEVDFTVSTMKSFRLRK